MTRPVFRDSALLTGQMFGTPWYRDDKSECYVTIPPALVITDSTGAMWTLGLEYQQKGWRYFYNVLRNSVHTGEYAEKVEYHQRRVRIWTQDGWKTWTERKPGFFSKSPGYFV